MGLGLQGAYGANAFIDTLGDTMQGLETKRLLQQAMQQKLAQAASAEAGQREIAAQAQAAKAGTAMRERMKFAEEQISKRREQAAKGAETEAKQFETAQKGRLEATKNAAIEKLSPELQTIVRAGGTLAAVNPNDPTGEIAFERELKRDRERNAATISAAGAAAGLAANKPLTPTERLRETRELNNQYEKNVQGPRRMLDAYHGMQDALAEVARTGKLNAASNVVINNFLKTLDPNSAVMQGEFLRIGGGQSFFDKLRGRTEALVKGGPNMTKEALEEFTAMSKLLAQRARRYTDQESARITSIADEFKLNKDHIFTPIDADADAVDPTNPAGLTFKK